MNILYVISRPLEINTSSSIRNRATILGLLENGNDVEVVTTEPDQRHPAYDNTLMLEGISTTYIHLDGAQNAARLARRLKFLNPIKRIVYRWMSKNEIYDNLKGIINHTGQVDLSKKKYDVIISSSDPKSSHLFVDKLLERQGNQFHGQWIQIWGDPFLSDITRQNKRNVKEIKAEEERLIARADRVIYVSKLTLLDQKATYSAYASKMVYFPIPYMEKKHYKIRDLVQAKTIELVYCGDYNRTVRDIRPLYNAVLCMEGVHLTICGGSDMPMENCEKVTVLGRVPYEKVVELEEKADILVHLSNLHGTQIPGKIYQYSGTNKPILFILDGDIEQLKSQFERYNRYLFSENNPSDIQRTICRTKREKLVFEPVSCFEKRIIAKKLIMNTKDVNDFDQ